MPYAPVAPLLFRLNESPPHIAVAYQPVGKGDARFPRIAHRRRCRGIGNADYQIGVNRMLPGQLRAHLLPGGVHQRPVHHAVRARKVNPFKDAEGAVARRRALIHRRMDAVRPDYHHFPRRQLLDELGLQMIQSAGFGRRYPAVFQPAQAQRTDAQRVAGRNHRLRRQQRQRKRPFHTLHPVKQPLRPGRPRRIHQQMGNHFRVGSSLKNAAVFRLQPFPQRRRIDDVAVVRHGQSPVAAGNQQRLGIARFAGPGSGIARMADGQRAGQPVNAAVGESLGDQPHPGMRLQAAGVSSSHAGRFLPPVLQGKQPDRRQRSAVRPRRIQPDYPAFLAGMVQARMGQSGGAQAAGQPGSQHNGDILPKDGGLRGDNLIFVISAPHRYSGPSNRHIGYLNRHTGYSNRHSGASRNPEP